MSPLILHHFDASPFAEKVRLAFGIKRLAWRSVQIPMVMPKPLLMPLTGGYRKTPVLQAGADIYCDTALILRELEARCPAPALYPPQMAGLGTALASWSDKAFFEPGAALSMALNTQIPDAVLNDRKAFFEFMDFDRLQESVPHMRAQFLAQMELVEGQLADGRTWLLGDAISVADVLAYFPLWMVRGNVPDSAPLLQRFRHTAAWEARLREIGHGRPGALDAQDALAIAASSEPLDGHGIDDAVGALRAGDRGSVVPTDYGAVPVVGELLTLTNERITLRRHVPALGALNSHFPRSGYRLERASA